MPRISYTQASVPATTAGTVALVLASCHGPVGNASPIDTSSTGTKTFTILAIDNVGNSSSFPVNYSVISGGGGGSTSADLGITVSAPAHLSPGGTMTYVIQVSNNGRVTATGVTVTDALPPGTIFASVSATQGMVATPAVGSNGTVTASIGTLANEATASISIVVGVTAASGTTLMNTATVSATTQDLESRNNSATQRTMIR
jgi:uncharacterized repeat protein (TIGR01451 family)